MMVKYPRTVRRRLYRSSLFSILATILTLFVISAVSYNTNAHAGIAVGDILVVSDSTLLSGVVRVDPVTGDRILISDFTNQLQGPVSDEPHDLVMETDGDIYVTDSDGGTGELGAIYHVNVENGVRTTLSDLGNPAQGPIGDLAQGLGLFSNGDLYYADRDAPNNNGGLFRIDKVTGFRTLVTDLADPGQGPLGDSARDVAEGPNGEIYLVTSDGGTNDNGLLFEVDPVTGFRTILSDFGDIVEGPVANPRWLAVPAVGSFVYVVNPSNQNNALFEVNTLTGNRTILSNFDNGGQGPTDSNVQGLAIDGSGQLLVNGNSSDVLFSINPAGVRTIISNYDNPAQGTLTSFAEGIVIATVASDVEGISVPTLSEWGLIAMAGLLGIVGYMVARRRKAVA